MGWICSVKLVGDPRPWARHCEERSDEAIQGVASNRSGLLRYARNDEVPSLRSLEDILEEYEFLDADERYRLLIELGRELDEMPQALKTDATLVRGCSASVWVYPVQDGDRLHFLADSNAAITKGIVALVLAAVQDQPASDVAGMDIAAALAPFDLTRQLSSNRTQGVPNMIALVQAHAARLANVPGAD